MKASIRLWTVRAAVLCLPLMAVGCDERDVDGGIGIAYSIFDLIYSIILIAD